MLMCAWLHSAAAHSTLAVPAKRRLSFDDGSDLSALTSDNDIDIDIDIENEDIIDVESEGGSESDNLEEEDHGEAAESMLDPALTTAQSSANGTSVQGGISAATQDAVASMLSAAATSDGPDYAAAGPSSAAMRPSTSESSNASSGNASKRGKGRPPRKQNAIAAAAKRQAQKSIKADAVRSARQAAGLPQLDDLGAEEGDLLLELEESTEAEGDEASARYHDDEHDIDSSKTLSAPSNRRRSRSKPTKSTSPAGQISQLHRYASSSSADEAEQPAALLSHAHRDLRAGYGVDTRVIDEDEDITSEAERLRAPLPPFPDDSADEDYNEKPRTSSAIRSRGRKQPRGGAKANTSPKRSPQSRKRQLEMQALDTQSAASGHELSDSGSEAPLQDSQAKIVVTDANGQLNVEPTGEVGFSAAQHALATELEAEDAMSGISEDIPILLQATAKAAAGPSIEDIGSPAVDEDGVSVAATPDPTYLENGQFASNGRKEGTPELDADGVSRLLQDHLPIPTSSRGRAKSPSGTSARGRGRGSARGRGKHRNFHKAIEPTDDADAAVSGAEGAATAGERDGTPPLETPMTSDVEDGEYCSTPAAFACLTLCCTRTGRFDSSQEACRGH